MSLLPFVRHPVAAVALSLLSVGCATNPDGTFKKNADGTFVIDEKAKGAMIGAAAGCALAAATDQDCVKGAVVGAVVGFLISWYFESKKLADAETVNKEYAKAKVKDKPKPPKDAIIPAAFNTQVVESKPDAQGQREVQITSNTDLIGYGDKKDLDVQQRYAIYDENNKLIEEKTEKVTAVDGAGRYQTQSKFKHAPSSGKSGKYTAKTALIVNGKSYKENSYKIAFHDDGHTAILALAN